MRRCEYLGIRRCFLHRVILIVCSVLVLTTLLAAYAHFIEPTWIRIQRLELSSFPAVRIVHITDIHFDGNTRYLEKVVTTINKMEADFVCFTGDLIEEAAYLEGALQILSRIDMPIYGIPGNHDQWALHSFDDMRDSFRRSGGELLSEDVMLIPALHVALMNRATHQEQTPLGYRRILLEHNPSAVKRIQNAQFDLILAGHTHGGQVRLPVLGTRVLPFDLDPYDRGLFETPCGPLYVNPGIGTYHLSLRFGCRPEITLIKM